MFDKEQFDSNDFKEFHDMYGCPALDASDVLTWNSGILDKKHVLRNFCGYFNAKEDMVLFYEEENSNILCICTVDSYPDFTTICIGSLYKRLNEEEKALFLKEFDILDKVITHGIRY